MEERELSKSTSIRIRDKITNLRKLRPSIFIKFRDIYKKHLIGWNNIDIAEHYNCSTKTIARAISYMAVASDIELASDKLAITIERDRIDARLKELHENMPDPEIDIQVYLNFMKEMRNNQELRMKLDGLMRIKVDVEESKNLFVLVHHVERPKNKITNAQDLEYVEEKK
jgi:hypothetical protein